MGFRIFFGPLSTEKVTNFQNFFEKTLYMRVAQKRYNFAPGVANHTFFINPVYIIYIHKYCLPKHYHKHISLQNKH